MKRKRKQQHPPPHNSSTNELSDFKSDLSALGSAGHSRAVQGMARHGMAVYARRGPKNVPPPPHPIPSRNRKCLAVLFRPIHFISIQFNYIAVRNTRNRT